MCYIILYFFKTLQIIIIIEEEIRIKRHKLVADALPADDGGNTVCGVMKIYGKPQAFDGPAPNRRQPIRIAAWAAAGSAPFYLHTQPHAIRLLPTSAFCIVQT